MVAYSFKARFIGPVRAGLGIKHLNERGKETIPGPVPKRQTIRANGKRRHARPGELVQLYYAMRTRQCMLIGKGDCTDTRPTRLVISPTDADLDIFYDGHRLKAHHAEDFAKADGFGSIEDMWLFWRETHPATVAFEGTTIKWEPAK